MSKYFIPIVLAIVASVVVGVQPVPAVQAACPYTSAAQSTGKITCTPNGYALDGSSGSAIPGVLCKFGTRALTVGQPAHITILFQPNAC